MPYKRKNCIGARSIRAKRVRRTRRAETAEARMKRLSSNRDRVALVRAQENEEARAIRLKRGRENIARRRERKAAAEANAHRAEIFRRLTSDQNTDNNEKHETENVDVSSEYPFEVAVKCEMSDEYELDPIDCAET